MSKISTTRKAVALAAAATMTAGAFPATAFADDPFEEPVIVQSEESEVEEQKQFGDSLETTGHLQIAGENDQEEAVNENQQLENDTINLDEEEPRELEVVPSAQSNDIIEESPIEHKEEPTPFTVSTDDELQAAVEAAESGQIIEVTADIKASPITFSKDIVLLSTNGSKITAKQSGTLFTVNAGTLSIEGLQIETKGNVGLRANREASIVLCKDTAISGGMYTVATVGGNITISDVASVSSTSEAVLVQNGGTCTIEKGAHVLGYKAGLSVLSGAQADVYGTVEGAGDESFGIAGQGTASLGNIAVRIHPGAVISGGVCGIYAPAVGSSFEVDGGTITGGWSGIEVRAGRLDISDSPLIRSTWAGTLESAANSNGATVKGAAIAVSQHTTKDDIDINITGGTFEGLCAFYEDNPQGNEQSALDKVDISISGGKFISVADQDAVVSANKDGFISGGVFSSNPKAYLAEGYRPTGNADGTYEIESPEEYSIARVTAADGTVSYYDDFASAVDAAAANETVTLLKDTTVTDSVTIDKALNVDLGGNTLTTTYNSVTLLLQADGIEFKNGSIDSTKSGNAAMRVNSGSATLRDIALDCGYRGVQVLKGSMSVIDSELRSAYAKTDRYIVTVGNSSSPNTTSFDMVNSKIVNTASSAGSAANGGGIQAQYGAEVNIDENSSINMSSGCGIQVFDDSMVYVHGSIYSADDYGIANYGGTDGKTNPTIKIVGATVASDAEDASGVYLPAPNGATSIENSTISGFDGVSVRGGKLIVTGSEVTSNAAELKDPSQVSNGSVNIGAAIVSVPHTHHAPIDITIESGTFTGPAALYETAVDDKDTTVSISIEDGTFISSVGGDAIVSDNCEEFIHGGNYSSWSAAAYVPEGYALIDNGPVDEAPFVLGLEEDMNDISAGYLETGNGNKAFFTDKDALDDVAAAAGMQAVPTKRTIVFVDRKGNVIKEVIVDYGQGVPQDEIPQLDDEQLSYKDEQGRTHEFTGWSVSPTSEFTENTEIAPTYGEKMIYSTITFVNGLTGETIAEVSAPNAYELVDVMIPVPAPTIEHDSKTYKFAGWDEDPENYLVDGDKTFTANYTEVDGGEAPETPETPDDPGIDTPNGDNDNDNDADAPEDDAPSDEEESDDDQAGNDDKSGEDGKVEDNTDNIVDDTTALCEPDQDEKLHQTGDEIPYVIGGGIAAAFIALAVAMRRKMRS